jgi:hypothetical protein
VKARLNKLPQLVDEWEVDFRELPVLVEDTPSYPWVILVVSRTMQRCLGNQICPQQPSATLLWDEIARCMQRPLAGEPHRPTTLLVRSAAVWEELRLPFRDIGIDVTPAAGLDHWEELFQDLTQFIAGPEETSLVELPGVTPEMVGAFYDAAAYFHQQAPWRRLAEEAAIEVRWDRSWSGPWYAIVMGAAGLTSGLTLYDDFNILRQLWEAPGEEAANAAATRATTVTFGGEDELPEAEVEAIRRHGWRIARRNAYPHFIHVDPGMQITPPKAWELTLMEACLRALPGFIQRRRPHDPTPEEVVVPTGSGEATLSLRWVQQ